MSLTVLGCAEFCSRRFSQGMSVSTPNNVYPDIFRRRKGRHGDVYTRTNVTKAIEDMSDEGVSQLILFALRGYQIGSTNNLIACSISIYLSIYPFYVKFSMLAQFRRSHE